MDYIIIARYVKVPTARWNTSGIRKITKEDVMSGERQKKERLV